MLLRNKLDVYKYQNGIFISRGEGDKVMKIVRSILWLSLCFLSRRVCALCVRTRQRLLTASASYLVFTSPILCFFSGATALTCDKYEVTKVNLIGEGGTGNVYSAKVGKIAFKAAFKIGKPNTNARLTNECNILKHLDTQGSKGVTKCLASCEVSPDTGESMPSKKTIGILMTPLASKESVGTMELLSSPSTEKIASRNIITTLVDMV